MKIGFSLLAVLVSAISAPAADQGKSGRLMDDIEEQVRLPEGASSLQRYARHYAFHPDGKVIGVYVLRLPSPPKEADYGCDEIILEGDDFTSKPIPCPPEPDTSDEIAPGERQWFDNHTKLPLINDGGCMVVNVIFDPVTHQVEKVFCNGLA